MSVHCSARCIRRGLSILEFLGCLIAVAGGVVIGSIYLGIDVQETAVGLLERAQVIPTPPQPAPTAVAQPVMPSNSRSPLPGTPGRGAGGEGSTSDPGAQPTTTEPAPTDALSLTPEQREELTRVYWDALNVSMKAESDFRHTANQATGEWELYDYLSRRSEGHQTAADAIAKLSLRGVDAHIAAYAERVLDWHEKGATLFARAKDLLTDAPTAQLSGPFAQSWQSAATQHRMEERLLKEKHQAVQSYLDHAGQ